MKYLGRLTQWEFCGICFPEKQNEEDFEFFCDTYLNRLWQPMTMGNYFGFLCNLDDEKVEKLGVWLEETRKTARGA